MRPGLGRPVRSRRRCGPVAACRPARNRGGAAALDFQPCRRAPGLGAAGNDPALAPWPSARSRPSASPAGRTGARADVRRRGTGRARAAACRDRIRRLAHDRARSAGRSARTSARDDGRRLRPRRRRRAQHRRDRGRGRAGCARARTHGRPFRRAVRARRPDHQARDPRHHIVGAVPAAGRIALGRGRRRGLGGDRMDAGRSVDARGRDRSARRAGGAGPPQRRGIRRADARDRRGQGACGLRTGSPGRMRSSSAAAPAMRVSSTPPWTRSGPAAVSSSTR